MTARAHSPRTKFSRFVTSQGALRRSPVLWGVPQGGVVVELGWTMARPYPCVVLSMWGRQIFGSKSR